MNTCVDLSFIKFGECKTPESTLSVDVNKISKTISDSIMSSITTSETNVVVVQNQNVNVIGSCCSPIKIKQDAALKVIESTSINVSMVSNILNQMKNQYNNEIDKVQPQLNKITGDNIGKNITTSIKESMSKTIQDESIQNSLKEKLLNIIASQTQNVQINCSDYIPVPSSRDGSCTITQDFLLQLEINNVFEDIFSQVMVDPSVIDAINQYTEKSLIVVQEVKEGEFVPFWKGRERDIVMMFAGVLLIIMIRKIITMILK
jgi:hypothetical protein